MAFDPYYKWLGIPPDEQPPNHYRLLGLRLYESDSDVIDAAANRQMAYVQQCATGPHLVASQKLLNELSAARLCLLTPRRRVEYDEKLRATLQSPIQVEFAAASWQTWINKRTLGVAVVVLLAITMLISVGIFGFPDFGRGRAAPVVDGDAPGDAALHPGRTPAPRPGFLHFNPADGVEIAETAGLLDVNGTFTLELWVRWPEDGKAEYIVTDEVWPGMHSAITVPATGGWMLSYNAEGLEPGLHCTFACPEPVHWMHFGGGTIESTNEWHHVAVVKTPDAVDIFVDGHRRPTKAVDGTRFTASSTNIFLGVRRYALSNRRFNGDIRAFRLCSAVRYTHDFSPSTSWPRDDDTLVLFDVHADDQRVVEDLSGKKRIGLPLGAQVLPLDESDRVERDSTNAAAKARPNQPGAKLNWHIGESQCWRRGMRPISFLERGRGFCILTELAGAFVGGGESFELAHLPDKSWEFRGTSVQDSLRGSARAIQAGEDYVVEEFVWRRGDAPVRLIHERDGFAVLSGVWGGLHGGGEAGWLRLDADGFWWLEGMSQDGSFTVKALTIRTGRRLPTATFRVRELNVPLKLIHRDQGICFLSGISGWWGSDTEHAEVSLHDDGYWYFDFGRANDSATANATAIFTADYAPDWRQLTRDLNDFSHWTPLKGEWRAGPEEIVGKGESWLRFNHLLPQDVDLKFTLNVKAGMRPRILVNNMDWFYVGNEGDRPELFAFGNWLADIGGTPRAYQNGKPMAIEMRLYRDSFEFRVDGDIVARGRPRTPVAWELVLLAGDSASPGECAFSKFKVSPANPP